MILIMNSLANKVKECLQDLNQDQKEKYLKNFIPNYLFFVCSPLPFLPRGFFGAMTNTKTRLTSFEYIHNEPRRLLCSVVNLFNEISLIGWKFCYKSWDRLFWNLRELLPNALEKGREIMREQ
jgi:hypothetical protein